MVQIDVTFAQSQQRIGVKLNETKQELDVGFAHYQKGGQSAGADWSQNDPAGAGYVQHRPGGYDVPGWVQFYAGIIPAAEDGMSEIGVQIPADAANSIKVGDEIRVTIDGVATVYTAREETCAEMAAITFGPNTYADLMDSEEVPSNYMVCIIISEEDVASLICAFGADYGSSGSSEPIKLKTIKIEMSAATPVKIEQKYLDLTGTAKTLNLKVQEDDGGNYSFSCVDADGNQYLADDIVKAYDSDMVITLRTTPSWDEIRDRFSGVYAGVVANAEKSNGKTYYNCAIFDDGVNCIAVSQEGDVFTYKKIDFAALAQEIAWATVTETSTGDIVCDKTYSEIKAALDDGKLVVAKIGFLGEVWDYAIVNAFKYLPWLYMYAQEYEIMCKNGKWEYTQNNRMLPYSRSTDLEFVVCSQNNTKWEAVPQKDIVYDSLTLKSSTTGSEKTFALTADDSGAIAAGSKKLATEDYVNAAVAETGETWELIGEATCAENAQSFIMDKDADGNPFALKEIAIITYSPAFTGDTTSYGRSMGLYPGCRWGTFGANMANAPMAKNNEVARYELHYFKMYGGGMRLVRRWMSQNSTNVRTVLMPMNNAGDAPIGFVSGAEDPFTLSGAEFSGPATCVKIYGYTNNTVSAGTKVKVWGVRA